MSDEFDINSPLYAVYRAIGAFNRAGTHKKIETVQDLIIVLKQDKQSLIESLRQDESLTYELFLLMAEALEKGLDQEAVGAKLILAGSQGHFDRINNNQNIKNHLRAHGIYNYNLVVKGLERKEARLAVRKLINFSSNIEQYLKNGQSIYDEFNTWFLKQDPELCYSIDSEYPQCAKQDHLDPNCDFRAMSESRFAEMKSGIDDLDSE